MKKFRLSRLFRKRASKSPVSEPQQFHRPPEHIRFIAKQLSHQSEYFPGLTKTHNKFLLNPSFHSKKTPVITGNRFLDAKLTRNMKKMLKLEKEINNQTQLARSVHKFEKTRQAIERVTQLEKEFNDLKKENFLMFQQHFGPGKSKTAETN